MKKRAVISLMMSAALALNMTMTVMADTYDISNGNITVAIDDTDSSQKVTQNSTTRSDDAPVITGNSNTNTVTLDATNGDVNVTFSNLNISITNNNAPVNVIDNSVGHNVTIELDGTNNLTMTTDDYNGQYHAALEDNIGGELTIKDESGTPGILNATGGDNGAGIGGGPWANGSHITINGGTINAVGGYSAAGIGGGMLGSGYLISISSSATVNAAGGAEGPDHYSGTGAAIGNGGSDNGANGTSISPDVFGPYSSGSVNLYPAGTTVAQIQSGEVDQSLITHPATLPTTPPDQPQSASEPQTNHEPGDGGFTQDIQSAAETTAGITFAAFQEDTSKLLLVYLTETTAGGASAQTLKKNGINLDTGNVVSFKKETYALIDQLTKKGITVRIKFFYKGSWYLVTIPAGTDISTESLCNAEGYCGFMNLRNYFDSEIIK